MFKARKKLDKARNHIRLEIKSMKIQADNLDALIKDLEEAGELTDLERALITNHIVSLADRAERLYNLYSEIL